MSDDYGNSISTGDALAAAGTAYAGLPELPTCCSVRQGSLRSDLRGIARGDGWTGSRQGGGWIRCPTRSWRRSDSSRRRSFGSSRRLHRSRRWNTGRCWNRRCGFLDHPAHPVGQADQGHPTRRQHPVAQESREERRRVCRRRACPGDWIDLGNRRKSWCHWTGVRRFQPG